MEVSFSIWKEKKNAAKTKDVEFVDVKKVAVMVAMQRKKKILFQLSLSLEWNIVISISIEVKTPPAVFNTFSLYCKKIWFRAFFNSFSYVISSTYAPLFLFSFIQSKNRSFDMYFVF